MQEVKENEICMVLPASFATGEPGDPLSEPVCEIIGAMIRIGYGALDFGESDDQAIELWFSRCNTTEDAREMSEYFIKRGGDV